MNKSLKTLCLIILILLSPIILVLSIGLMRMSYFLVMGYPFDMTGGELAEIIVGKNQDASRCDDLHHTLPDLGPTVSDQRMTCIYDVASMRKDPNVCELLMPSSYGLSCIGGAKEERSCLFSDQKTVVWNDGEYHEVPFENCAANTKDNILGTMCCAAAASKFDPDFDGCQNLKNVDQEIIDHCQYQVAVKKLEPQFCDRIKSKNLQSACTIESSVLAEYPELRKDYKFLNE